MMMDADAPGTIYPAFSLIFCVLGAHSGLVFCLIGFCLSLLNMDMLFEHFTAACARSWAEMKMLTLALDGSCSYI